MDNDQYDVAIKQYILNGKITDDKLTGNIKFPYSSFIDDYELLNKKPKINDIELIGNKLLKDLFSEDDLIYLSEEIINRLPNAEEVGY